jgi:hypothetical protein
VLHRRSGEGPHALFTLGHGPGREHAVHEPPKVGVPGTVHHHQRRGQAQFGDLVLFEGQTLSGRERLGVSGGGEDLGKARKYPESPPLDVVDGGLIA